jgi:hypothetical protein
VKTTAFCNLPKEALVKLISSDYLGLEEEDVWRAVLNWAKYQVRTDGGSDNKDTSPRERTEQKSIIVLGSLLYLLKCQLKKIGISGYFSLPENSWKLGFVALRDNLMFSATKQFHSFINDLTMIACTLWHIVRVSSRAREVYSPLFYHRCDDLSVYRV